MDRTVAFGISNKGCRTALYKGYEYVKHREYEDGSIQWRCRFYQSIKCKATIKTFDVQIINENDPEHNHDINPDRIKARIAIQEMKINMRNNLVSPSNVIGSVLLGLQNPVLLHLPKRQSLKRTLQRTRSAAEITNDSQTFPRVPRDMSFDIPTQFAQFILFDSGANQPTDRIIILGCKELLDGLTRSSLWIADGTFKVCPSLFFQLYTIHFEYVPGIVPAALYCLLEKKTSSTYTRILKQLQIMIPTASPTCIILDFESAARSSFQQHFPNASILGCYFHLCQSVQRKVQELGLKNEYETNGDLRMQIRSLPALAMVPPEDVANSFDLLAESMPENEKIVELLSYFEHTYIQGRRRVGRGRNFGPAIFPIETWNHYQTAVDGISRTTNAAEGWHYGIQSLFQCSHPTMWKFLNGISKDILIQKTSYLQGTAGTVVATPRRYRELKQLVINAVERYNSTDVLTYLQALAHLSYRK